MACFGIFMVDFVPSRADCERSLFYSKNGVGRVREDMIATRCSVTLARRVRDVRNFFHEEVRV